MTYTDSARRSPIPLLTVLFSLQACKITGISINDMEMRGQGTGFPAHRKGLIFFLKMIYRGI